jgi:hypothetical protein
MTLRPGNHRSFTSLATAPSASDVLDLDDAIDVDDAFDLDEVYSLWQDAADARNHADVAPAPPTRAAAVEVPKPVHSATPADASNRAADDLDDVFAEAFDVDRMHHREAMRQSGAGRWVASKTGGAEAFGSGAETLETISLWDDEDDEALILDDDDSF